MKKSLIAVGVIVALGAVWTGASESPVSVEGSGRLARVYNG